MELMKSKMKSKLLRKALHQVNEEQHKMKTLKKSTSSF